MKKKYCLQKQVKRGTKLVWECEFSSYLYDEVEGHSILKDTQHNNYRIKTFIEVERPLNIREVGYNEN